MVVDIRYLSITILFCLSFTLSLGLSKKSLCHPNSKRNWFSVKIDWIYKYHTKLTYILAQIYYLLIILCIFVAKIR